MNFAAYAGAAGYAANVSGALDIQINAAASCDSIAKVPSGWYRT
jgi:hypothetical protein